MKRRIARLSLTFALVVGFFAAASAAQQGPRFQLPLNVEVKTVTIWSEGSRLDGDLYYPKGLKDEDRLPAIVLSHGWGGTKRSSRRPASKFAGAGYITLAFTYRSWGQSEGKMILLDPMPELNENNEATVRVRFVREVVDPLDWAQDFRAALDFLTGEPNVDTRRIGAWGTSYGGGMVIWSAAHDDRIQAVVSQVGGMGVPWPAMKQRAPRQAVDIARGDADPVPQGVDKTGSLRGTPHFAKMIRYNAVEVAHRVQVPTLVIDAENEELFDRRDHGMRVFEIIRSSGSVPVRYEVMPGIQHYGIYREAYEKSSDMALEWFNLHLK